MWARTMSKAQFQINFRVDASPFLRAVVQIAPKLTQDKLEWMLRDIDAMFIVQPGANSSFSLRPSPLLQSFIAENE